MKSTLILNTSRLYFTCGLVFRRDGNKLKHNRMGNIIDLPYLNAVIKETMRLHLAVPLLVPHKSESQVKLGKYIVPKNTQILVKAWAIARDPRYWDYPLMFKPERFLGNELDYKGQHFEFIPFGSGRRICPGMPLAHRVVSLMVASFVYHFDWDAREEMDMNDIFGLTLLSHCYSFICQISSWTGEELSTDPMLLL